MKIYYFFIIFLFFIGCSFDNKTGIWENNDISIEKKTDQLSDFKNLSVSSETFSQIIKIDEKYSFQSSSTLRSENWTDKFYSQSNNLENFFYNEKNELTFKSKKLSRHNLNKTFLVEENNLITSDEKGNLIIYSIISDKKKIKFNFYKNKLKNINKILYKIVKDNIVYISDNIGYLYAYNYKHDKLLWAKNYKIPFRSNLKIIDNRLISINQNNELIVFDIKTGEIINLIPTEEIVLKNYFLSNISLDKNNIYFLNTFGSLYSVNSKNMQINWFINLNQTTEPKNNGLFSGTEVIYKNKKLIVLTNSFTYIIDSNTGRIIYKINFSSLIKPLVKNNNLFVISKNNLLIVFDIANGKIIYSKDINQIVSNFNNTKKKNLEIKYFLQVNNKLLIFLENSYLITVNLYGKIEKMNRLPSKILSYPIIINGSILYINSKNKIVKVD